MAPRSRRSLRSGDWRLRLSWPGTPAASFRWGRVVTINVSPDARPALLIGMQSAVVLSLLACGQPTRGTPRTRPIPTRHSLREQPTLGSVAGAPRPWPVTPCVGTTDPARRRERAPGCEYGPSATDRALSGASSSVWAPESVRLSLPTETFHAAGCVSSRAGAFDAVGDRNPVPERAGCPRPYRNVPAQAPEATRQVRATGPHRLGWTAPIPAALRARRGPPGAPGYGHRPAPARCAGGP